MADGRHLKKPYVCNDFTDVDEIWHGDACWPRTADMSLKYQFFWKIQDGGGCHFEKSQ